MKLLIPTLLALLASAASAQSGDTSSDTSTPPAGADPALVDRGRHLATAGDCAACHGDAFAGGDPIVSPMGNIYASNITPDDAAGIGTWTLDEFSDLLRKGVAPDGHLFPAMPYTSYTGLADDEIRALYSYLMLGVDAVATPVPETDLPFPFVRPAMIVWNALFLDEGHATGAVHVEGEQLERGQHLVESLGHCSACHSPRGALMQQDPDRHLGGAMTGGWWAPNITPDPSGIGGWDDERLTRFLTTGHTDVAVAAGDMGTVVSKSLSRLPPQDMQAIVAYLRVVPPVSSDAPVRAVDAVEAGSGAATATTAMDASVDPGWEAMLGHDAVAGAQLYQGACASCHGPDGTGSDDLAHPSLHEVQGVVAPQGATLVQVIAHGVNRRVGSVHALMPGYRDQMSDAQIASLANFVRTTFGGVAGDVDVESVQAILAGDIDTPWLIGNARWLAIAALALVALALGAGIVMVIRAGRRGRRPAPS